MENNNKNIKNFLNNLILTFLDNNKIKHYKNDGKSSCKIDISFEEEHYVIKIEIPIDTEFSKKLTKLNNMMIDLFDATIDVNFEDQLGFTRFWNDVVINEKNIKRFKSNDGDSNG